MAYIRIDVDLDEFDEDDLVNELEYRGYTVIKGSKKSNTPKQVSDITVYDILKIDIIKEFFESLSLKELENLKNIHETNNNGLPKV